jgi:hypothetical protein
VQKSALFSLIRDLSELSENSIPIIVGSQAAYAVTERLPEIARTSIECDFLFAFGQADLREKINKQMGVLTEYQDKHGYYADAVGLATIVLPNGWEDRLRPLLDENGKVVAQCVDIYDVAASKLVAGRPKDYVFLESLFASDLILVPEFLERADLVGSKVENDVLKDRLTKLVEVLKPRHIHFEIIAQIKEFLRLRAQ